MIRSVRHLKQEHGQIATFLILLMAVVLIFAMMTANFGQVAQQATQAANAADAAALYLASQLATKANQLYEALGRPATTPPRFCQTVSIWRVILAALFALFVTVISSGTGASIAHALIGSAATTTAGAMTTMGFVTAGMAAGVVGGTVGGRMDFGSWSAGLKWGLTQGALLGASIGYGAARFGIRTVPGGSSSITAPNPLTGGQALSPSLGQALGVSPTSTVAGITNTTLSSAGITTIPSAGLTTAPTLGIASPLTGAAAVGGLGAATQFMAGRALTGGLLPGVSAVYTAYMDMRMKEAAIEALARELNGLPDTLRIEQGTIFEVFRRLIDDPTTVPDRLDLDGDNNRTESIPFFQEWWHRRLRAVKDEDLRPLPPLVTQFINGPLARMETAAWDAADGVLYRWQVEGGGDASYQGDLENLCGILETNPNPRRQVDCTFWEPGPNQAQLEQWDRSCNDCPPPPGYSEEDVVQDGLLSFTDLAGAIRQQDQGLLASAWEMWARWFYDPDNPDDYSDLFKAYADGRGSFKGINRWIKELDEIKEGLPRCRCEASGFLGRREVPCDQPVPPGWTFLGVTNAPCRIGRTGRATADADIRTDEFAIVRTGLTTLINEMTTFHDAAAKFVPQLLALGAQSLGRFGGRNPANYEWCDSGGYHRVTARVIFRLPQIIVRKSGFLNRKACQILTNYEDREGTFTWVVAERQDQVGNKSPSPRCGDLETPTLWTWNPHGGHIARVSRPYYRYTPVKGIREAGIRKTSGLPPRLPDIQ